jgi:dihydroorotate dehydrogenase
MFRLIIRPLLFKFSPEKAHYLTASLLHFFMLIPGVTWMLRKMYLVQNEKLRLTKRGLSFPNAVGLAAGFDKNATLYKDFQHLGFGFIEVGTVTPKAQDGNPKPRLFRLPNDRALINRMGFNNFGVDAMVNQLKNRPKDLIVGGNIGKNKVTPEELAHEDYLISFHKLYDSVDYFAVNVSSPNTPGLRNLQGKEPLRKLLTSIVEARKSKSVSKPILLKIAPDMNDSQLDDVVEIVLETEIDGIIATNTTISRDGLNSRSYEIKACGDGGLSGWPLKARSTRIVKMVRERLTPDHLIIGCGGIETAEDAIEKLEAGADLVQIYTGFIYEGPALVKRINQAILNR